VVHGKTLREFTIKAIAVNDHNIIILRRYNLISCSFAACKTEQIAKLDKIKSRDCWIGENYFALQV
jgi:hypothetical protein